jgi:hypothetical protein
VKKPEFGVRRVGEAIGTADVLQFAVLNKRPDGLWALVEPSKLLLQVIVCFNFLGMAICGLLVISAEAVHESKWLLIHIKSGSVPTTEIFSVR